MTMSNCVCSILYIIRKPLATISIIRLYALCIELPHCMGRGIHPSELMMHIAYSPYFPKIFKCRPIFVQFTFLCLIYVFASPYFDHDVFMHHALHVLDATANASSYI